jgi:hypothetical protein
MASELSTSTDYGSLGGSTFKQEAADKTMQFASQQKDFLFDKYAAAYYGRFSDYDPSKDALYRILMMPLLSQETSPPELETLSCQSYYQVYCE